MERLTIDYINGLIDSEDYIVEEQYVQCILMVGEAPVIGISYRFSKATHDPERAKKAARDDAIRQLFSLEAYHQKRIRPMTNGNFQELLGANFETGILSPGNPYVGLSKAARDLIGSVDAKEPDEKLPLMHGGNPFDGMAKSLAQPTQLQPIPDSTLASRLAEYENRLNEGGKACLYIESETEIAELNELNDFFKPKHIHIRPDLKLDTTSLKGYCVVVEGRDGDYVLNV